MSRILTLCMAMVCALLLGPAHAQVPTVTGGGSDIFARLMSTNVASATVQGVTDGASLLTTGNANITGVNGAKSSVPIAAKATISKAAMASAAVKLVRAGTVVGAAYQTYEVYNWIKQSGITTCAPPDFFCKPSPTASIPEYSYALPSGEPAGFSSSPMSACQILVAGFPGWQCDSIAPNYPYLAQQSNPSTGATTSANVRFATCTNGGLFQVETASCIGGTGSTAGSPYTDAELASGLIGTGGNWDPARGKGLMEAIQRDNAKQNVLTQNDLRPPAAPLSWEGAPVTSPPVVTKLETVPNADGTTSTRKTTETTTVTPSLPADSTLGSPKFPEFKTSTNTVVTNTNNTTNITTTESNTTTNYAPAADAPKLDIPDDYAREKTLQKIEADLNTDAAKEMPDQGKLVTDGVKDGEDRLKALRDAIPTSQTGEDKSAFFSWVWTAPIGSCIATPGVTTKAGFIAFDYCPTVNNIRDLMGWLFGMFGAIMIYNQIFGRND